MRTIILTLTLIFGAHAAHAANVFLLHSGPSLRQGISRLDTTNGIETPFASFIFNAYLQGVYGGLQLTAVDDRIIAQGRAYYDFNASTGQLLRRYPALPAQNSGWSLQGPVIDESTARSLGVQPGFYAIARCLPLGESLTCAGEPPADSINVLLRRSLHPGDASAEFVGRFHAADDLVSATRFVAFDAAHEQFWSLIEGSKTDGSGVKRFTRTQVAGGVLGNEIIDTELTSQQNTPDDQIWSSTGLTYASGENHLLYTAIFPYLRNESRIIARSNVSTTVLRSTPGDVDIVYSLTAAPLTKPATYTQLVPAVADTPGANGTTWSSDAWLYNPADQTVRVTLSRVTAPTTTKALDLGPGESCELRNILRQLGGGVAAGFPGDALVVTSDYHENAQLSVYTRTYTRAAQGGTYGQAVPAVPDLVGYSNHLTRENTSGAISETASLFLLDKRDPTQFRHNVGIVNTTDSPITITMRYAILSLGPVSDSRLEKSVTAVPHNLTQVNIESLFPDAVTTRPPYIVVRGDQPAAMWLSIVDNKTGDATFVPFTFYAVEASPDSALVLPAVTHTPGAHQTLWRTDIYGLVAANATYPITKTIKPQVTYRTATTSCTSAAQSLAGVLGFPGDNSWPETWFTIYPDAARQVCQASDSFGALEVGTGSWTSMVARTYTTRADGGTYGDMLPLYPPYGWPSRHFAGIQVNNDVRVNIGLYNGESTTTTTVLRLRRTDGTIFADRTITLTTHESFQQPLPAIFGDGIPTGLYALSVLPLDGTHCWPYISTVDNVTGDPTNWW